MSKKTKTEIEYQSFPFFGLDIDTLKAEQYLKAMAEEGYTLYSEQLVLNSEGGIQTFIHRKIVDANEVKKESYLNP